MSSFTMVTRSKSSLPLVNSLVQNRVFKTAPDIEEPPFQFIHTMDLCLVDTTLHDSPDLVIYRIEIWAVWRPQVGRKKVWCFLMQQFNCCVPVHCPAETQSRYQTLHIAGSSKKWEIQLYVCGQIISVCNSERIIKIGQYQRKLCSNERGSSFLTHSVDLRSV